MTGNKSDEIKRSCCFLTSEQQIPLEDFLDWLAEEDGTFLTNSKATINSAFDSRTIKSYEKKGVVFQSTRGSYSLHHKRILLFRLIDKELSEVEHQVNISHAQDTIEEICFLGGFAKPVINWIRRYEPELLGDTPEDWNKEVIEASCTYELPEEISGLLEHIGLASKAGGNFLDDYEKDLLRKDLKEHKSLWSKVATDDVRIKCNEQKMDLKVINEVVEIVKKNKN